MIFFERDNFNVWLEKHKANLATYYILTSLGNCVSQPRENNPVPKRNAAG